MAANDSIKRNDQIKLLEIVREFTDTGVWKGTFTYPNCGYDLVLQGLATEDKKITQAGRVALWLLEKAPDPTDSKAVEVFSLKLPNNPQVTEGV
jgi:hypothetical protein